MNVGSIKILIKFFLRGIDLLLMALGILLLFIIFYVPVDLTAEYASRVFDMDATKRAPYYDEKVFSELRQGLSSKELIAKLGVPIHATCGVETSEKKFIGYSADDLLRDKFSCIHEGRAHLVYTHQGHQRGNYKITAIGVENGEVVSLKTTYEID